MHLILGIDFSTVRLSYKGKTCIAVGESLPEGLHVHEVIPVCGDDELLCWLQKPFTLCGIDAPLSLPPCIFCPQVRCVCSYEHWMQELGEPAHHAYHYRLSDIVVRKAVRGISPKPPLSNGGPVDITPLTLRWMRLARSLATEPHILQRVVEVYATGAIQLYAQWLGVTPNRTFHYRASLQNRQVFLEKMRSLGRLHVDDVLWKRMLESEDSLDAVMVALSTWHAVQGRILQPETLLGLDTRSAFGVQPIQTASSVIRRQIVDALLSAPWMVLPYLPVQSKKNENSEVNLDSKG